MKFIGSPKKGQKEKLGFYGFELTQKCKLQLKKKRKKKKEKENLHITGNRS